MTVTFELWHHFHIESWFLSILINNWKKLCLLRHSLCELRLISVVTKKTYYVLRGVLFLSIFRCIQIVLNYSSSILASLSKHSSSCRLKAWAWRWRGLSYSFTKLLICCLKARGYTIFKVIESTLLSIYFSLVTQHIESTMRLKIIIDLLVDEQ